MTPSAQTNLFGRASLALAVSALCLTLGGCKREAPSQEDASTSAQPAPSAPPSGPAAKPPGYPLGSTAAIGYPMEILPGLGIGPIRFGATFDTVARHMTRPCDVRSETRCLYIDQAVDFTMKDGVVDGIYILRRDRPAPPTADGKARYFGSFYGRLPPDVALGLHQHVVDEELRAPDRVEKLPTADENGTVARYYYDGMVLDFDKLDNGSTVLGAVRILPSKTATNPVKPTDSKAPGAKAPGATAPAPVPKSP